MTPPDPWLGTYDRQGNPISYEEYARLRYDEDDGECYRVALTYVGPYEVSTVWLGFDHRFGRGPLAIFETMVFAADEIADERGRRWDHYMERYATEAEAVVGHQKLVELLQEHFDARAATASPESVPAAVDVDESIPSAGAPEGVRDHQAC